MTDRKWSALLLALLMLSCSPVVDNRHADLKNEFSRAVQLFEEGRYGEAMPVFMEVARGLEAEGDRKRALMLYQNALKCFGKGGFGEGSPEAAMAAEARQKLAEPDGP